ncbi:hypothetical protein D3C80_639450 [compost metagenome]
MRVFHLTQVAQLFQHQRDFVRLQTTQTNPHAAFDGRRCCDGVLRDGRCCGGILLLCVQRKLPQRLTDVFKAVDVRLLRSFISVQLLLHNVFGFQKQVYNLGAQAHFLTPRTVQQVLQQVGGFLQHRKAKGRRTALDRVRCAKNGVQRLNVRSQRIQLQQVLLHVGQQLVCFIKKGLIKRTNIHAHGVTSAVSRC